MNRNKILVAIGALGILGLSMLPPVSSQTSTRVNLPVFSSDHFAFDVNNNMFIKDGATLSNIVFSGSATLSVSSANTAVVSDGAKKLISLPSVSTNEVGFLDGVTSAIQTQLNAKQALDADLTSISGLSSFGLSVRSTTDTFTIRTLTISTGDGLVLTNPDGISGNPSFALNHDLLALEALSTTGFLSRSATDTFVQRTLTGTALEVSVSNGDGISGNPTIGLASGIDTTKLADGSVTSTEFQYIGTLTSDAQTQLTAKQPVDTGLSSLSALTVAGIAVLSDTDTFTTRTITGTADQVSVANGTGVSGNPTISLPVTFYKGTSVLDFDLTSVTEQDLTISVTGASLSDPVSLGIPNSSVLTSTYYESWVSASDVVTVRARSRSATTPNPASGTFKVIVLKP